ncbi:hypothetical protein DV735_g3484, partial [Chaetothyriales sp. CBS 134920]
MALVYAILYLYFQAYPIIFQGVYNLSPGLCGLAFLPVMAGATSAMGIFLWYGSYYERAVIAGRSWTQIEEFRRLPLACISGPLVKPIFHNGYDLEVLEDGKWYRASLDDRLPSTHFAKSGYQPASEEIEHIIVSVKATQTVDALRSLKERLSSRSTILFLQNGYGMIEAVNNELFPDPSNRPAYISGVISHIVGKDGPFDTTHHGLSAVSLGLVPVQPVNKGSLSINTSHSANSAAAGTPLPIHNYLLDNLPRVPRFNATSNPYNLHLLHLLEKLTVNAFCNPLCALADAPNAYLFTIPETRRALLTEISNVINALPERDLYFAGAELAEFRRRFTVSQLEKTVSAIIEKTQSGTCSMVWDLRAGRGTEIQFING